MTADVPVVEGLLGSSEVAGCKEGSSERRSIEAVSGFITNDFADGISIGPLPIAGDHLTAQGARRCWRTKRSRLPEAPGLTRSASKTLGSGSEQEGLDKSVTQRFADVVAPRA